jgi:hypothetical protein
VLVISGFSVIMNTNRCVVSICSSRITEKLAAQTSGRGRAVFLFKHNEYKPVYISYSGILK